MSLDIATTDYKAANLGSNKGLEPNEQGVRVSMDHVRKTVKEMFDTPHIKAISSFSIYEKVFLIGMVVILRTTVS